MCHVYLNADYAVATDATVLVRISRALIDSKVEGLPEELYITPSEWAKLTKEFTHASFKNGMIKTVDKKGGVQIVNTLKVDSVGNFPNFGAVIRENLQAGLIASIGINPWRLKDVADAMNVDYKKPEEVTLIANFEADNRAVLLKTQYYDESEVLG